MMTSRHIVLIALCSMSMGLFASQRTESPVSDSPQDGLVFDSTKCTPKYTFSDFFDALDLPTVLGAGVTPSGIEGATFNSSMRLAWRHHKGYGTYVFIGFDTHSNTYDSLHVEGTNVRSGEVWYYEIGMGLGYRVPLVKNIREYYANPYFNNLDVFAYIQPGVSIPYLKTVVPYQEEGASAETSLYALRNYLTVVPTLRFGAGIEWFIVSNFGVFAEVSYIQHLKPTIIEKAAIEKGTIHNPSGPIVISIGLSLFFK